MWVSLDSLSLDSPLNLGVLGFIGFENCLIVYGDALLAGTYDRYLRLPSALNPVSRHKKSPAKPPG